MNYGVQIKQLAIEIANDIQERALSGKRELAEIKIRQAQIEAQLESAQLCRNRLSSFSPEIGRDLQCPRCWVVNETRTALTPIPGDHAVDRFKCSVCHLDLELPF